MFIQLAYTGLRPLLFRLDAERTHKLGIRALSRLGSKTSPAVLSQKRIDDPLQLAGLTFPNRVGLAAGLDKNASAIDGLAHLGFGFIEAGTVTPLAQQGNPKPRLFRLTPAGAIINRMGFNNAGLDVFCANVRRSCFRQSGGILGLNIGKNASTPIENAIDDYLLGLAAVYPLADYISINVSSPNTQNLRDLQNKKALDALLFGLHQQHQALVQQYQRHVPLFVKIAPDLTPQEVKAVAQSLLQHRMDGVIACNTSLDKGAVLHVRYGREQGGLSGKPLQIKSNQIIRLLRQTLGANFPIIGVGGVLSAADAVAKIKAGANLVQLYTGLIYRGPALVREAAQALSGLYE